MFILVLGVLSSVTFANYCPDLSGNYMCERNGTQFAMDVSHQEANGYSFYQYYYNDGETRFLQIVSDDGEANTWPNSSDQYIAQCGGDRVNYFRYPEGKPLFCFDLINEDGDYEEFVVKEGRATSFIVCKKAKHKATSFKRMPSRFVLPVNPYRFSN
jgi:hypothetical protein